MIELLAISVRRQPVYTRLPVVLSTISITSLRMPPASSTAETATPPSSMRPLTIVTPPQTRARPRPQNTHPSVDSGFYRDSRDVPETHWHGSLIAKKL